MPLQSLAPGVTPCVWMCAGLLRYRLCDRGLRCEGCPLDRALRGEPPPGPTGLTPPSLPRAAGDFPEDRLYTGGHLWIKPRPAGGGAGPTWTVGLDVFAAAVVGTAQGVRWVAGPDEIGEGEPICVLDLGLGALTVGAPVRGRVLRRNERLRDYPLEIVLAPYGEGWLVEFAPRDPHDTRTLLPAASAQACATADLRRLRSAVAGSVTAHRGETPEAQTPGAFHPDLRCLLGGDHYVEFVQALVH